MPAVLAHAAPSPGHLALLAAVAAAAFALRRTRPAAIRQAITMIAGGGLAFQVVHFAEHLLQLGYWFLHPTEPPWITPWAVAGRDLLAAAADDRAASGGELLHLLGNGVFLMALVAALALVPRGAPGRRPLVVATWIQGLHVGEHLALTVTWFAAGEALGVSTLFGAFAADDPRTGAVRVWAHLLINLAATVCAMRGAGALLPLRAGAHRAAAPGRLTAG